MNDLKEERNIIKAFVTSSGNVPVISEMTIDIHNPPRQALEKQIETCDCYLGFSIVGGDMSQVEIILKNYPLLL
jgi:hypothetical protein